MSGSPMSGSSRSGSSRSGPGWGPYLVGYHDDRPGITEQVLSVARDGDGRSPYDWLAEAVPPGSATVVDLACGSGPVARLLPGARVVGIDQSTGELAMARAVSPSALLVRARATAMPVADGAADAVVSSMALMLLAPLDAVLGEVRRVLRAGGTFAATVPVRSVGAESVFAEILDALGQVGTGYPCDLDSSSIAGRLAAAGLALEVDDTGLFTRTIVDEEDARVVVRSFYAPGSDDARVAAAAAVLERRLRSGPVRIGYRIRRLVAVARR
ncbi:MAG: hypothetical protein QOG82_550 [Actinomycetota bacterium]|nr:hypothetical protein [Actinomycetota bacterium]